MALAAVALGTLESPARLRSIAPLMLFVAPTMAALSVAAAVAASYYFWRSPALRFGRFALSAAALAYLLAASLFLPRSSLVSAVVAGTVLATIAIAAAFLWKLAMPRPLSAT